MAKGNNYPAVGVCRCVLKGQLSGQNTAMVFHIATNDLTPWTLVNLGTAATAVRTAYVAQFIPNQSPSFVLGECFLQDLSSPTGFTSSVVGSNAGTKGGADMPASVAMCVSWKTNLHFRGGHCRTYFGGLLQTDMLNLNTWSAATLTSWTTKANAFLTAVNGMATTPAAHMIMLSRWRKGIELNPPETYSVNSCTIDNRIDTQRRRLGRDR